ncbi:MAG: tetratricopeptide repeat protein [Gammaproteobacteria bacterium]|jgi:tetratricopeptide (TPR) repeat protein
MNAIVRLLPLACAALLLAACAGGPPKPFEPQAPAPEQQPPAETAPQPAPPQPFSSPSPSAAREQNPAVVALLNEAERQSLAGQYDEAATNVERALRIAPRDANLWHELAKLRLQQGQLQQAEALAHRSNSLAGQDRALQARNWALIAQARAKRGLNAQAEAARRKARELGAQ